MNTKIYQLIVVIVTVFFNKETAQQFVVDFLVFALTCKKFLVVKF